jgi:2-methylfumaryl-CoA isomerase
MAVITGSSDGTIAVDYTVNAGIGFPWVTGPADETAPVNHVMPTWDTLTGYLVAAGLLGAEMHRRETGEGQLVTVSLADVALAMASHLGFLAEAQLVPEDRRRYGNHVYGAFGRDFRTSDGRSVMVVALTPRQWQSLIEATGTHEAMRDIGARRALDLDDEGDRFVARDEISAVLAPWFAARTLADVETILRAHNVLYGPYRTFKQLLQAELKRRPMNPMLAEVAQPGIGTYLRASSPIAFSAFTSLPPSPAPSIGADTRRILRDWLGTSEERLDGLATRNVIGPT